MVDTPLNPAQMGPKIKPKTGRDAWIMRAFIVVIGLYLVITLALPLYAMLSKSVNTYTFDLSQYEIQINTGSGWGDTVSVAKLNQQSQKYSPVDLKTSSDGRLSIVDMISDFSFRSPTTYRLRNTAAGVSGGGAFLIGSERITGSQWQEFTSNEFRRVFLKPVVATGLDNFVQYFSNPSLFNSIYNSLFIAIVSMVITITLAFTFAYAMARSKMRYKGLFKVIAMAPILVPSLLPGIALVYLFGNQGMLNFLMGDQTIYGPIGIIAGSVFFTFPHAMIIIQTSLSISDARLYEASDALGASKVKTFFTVTLPGARYGLISAAFVVFNLVITDFGLPKVIGGQFNVLAVDIYKQVIGQQNFEMGAVVSVVLLIPAVFAFAIDRIVQKKQVSTLSARSVPYEPKVNRRFDNIMFAYCAIVGGLIVTVLAVCQFAALIKFWPYDLSLSLVNYDFDVMDGGGWGSFYNSIKLGLMVAFIGTIVVFIGAYMVEKVPAFGLGRAIFQFLAMLPMAIPGMVLGLAYIFFFNDPANPLNFIYGTMAILVICTVTHFYTVSHLTALTALKQMDKEFESVSSSLKQPFYKLFTRVTVPVCLPAILDISIYLFVNAMTTVSALIFIYSPDTNLASIAMLNMDDAGDIAPAAAMGMMIFYANAFARIIHHFASKGLYSRTQAWRTR